MNIYIDNINLIEFFRRTFNELKKYNISCEVYEQELNEIIENYETQKEKELKMNNEIILTTDYDNQLEILLFIKLSMLKTKLSDHILFLQLIDATKDWNLNNDIDELLIKIKNEKIVDSFSDIKIQKFILEKHSDLLLKKFLKDMENEDKSNIEKINNLEEHPLLKDSLSRYIHDNQININITNSLEETLEKIKNYSQTETKEEVLTGDVIAPKESLFKKIAKKFRKPNLNLVYLGSAKDEVVERIGEEKAERKDFTDCDLSGIDLFDVDFTNAILINTILTNTNAKIDTAKVVSLYNSNLEGCYVIDNFESYKKEDMPNLQGSIIVDDFDEDLPNVFGEKFFYPVETNKSKQINTNVENRKQQLTTQIDKIINQKALIEKQLENERNKFKDKLYSATNYPENRIGFAVITILLSIVGLAPLLSLIISPIAAFGAGILTPFIISAIPAIIRHRAKKYILKNYNINVERENYNINVGRDEKEFDKILAQVKTLPIERQLNKELSNLNKKQKELVRELKKLAEIKDEKNKTIDKQTEKRELLQNYSSLLQEAKNHLQMDKHLLEVETCAQKGCSMDFNIQEFILPSFEQVLGYFDPSLNLIKIIGNKCAITDFAIALGANVSHRHVNYDNSLKGRTGCYYTITPYGKYDIQIINDDGTWSCQRVSSRDFAIRPIAKLSSISCIPKEIIEEENDDFLEIKYGKYPQYCADLSTRRDLEELFLADSLRKTGKTYTTDSVDVDNYRKPFTAMENVEYEYNGKKYIRTYYKNKNNYYRNRSYQLSDKKYYNEGDIVWLEVSPLKWYVDKRTKIMLCKNLIAAGVRFCDEKNSVGCAFEDTEMYYFLNNYFAKDINPELNFQIQAEMQKVKVKK